MTEFLIDCDGGCDDALALSWLLGAKFPVRAVTTVAGNVSAGQAATNMRAIACAAGHPNLPVVAGAPCPLAGDRAPAPHVHGSHGLGRFRLTPADDPDGAGDAVRHLLTGAGGTLLCLGPLTNIALACALDRRFLSRFDRVVVMGGTLDGWGNATELAEFNFYVDPAATRAVLGAGSFPHVTFLGLDGLRASDPVTVGAWSAVVEGADPSWQVVLNHLAESLLCWHSDGEGSWIADLATAVTAAFPELAPRQRRSVDVALDESTPGLVLRDGAFLADWISRVDVAGVLDRAGTGFAALPPLHSDDQLCAAT